MNMFGHKYGNPQKQAAAMPIFFIFAVCAGIFFAGGEPARAASRIFDELKVKEEKSADADIWDGGTESFDESVAGDENDPYIIDTAKKLAYLAQSVNKGERYPGKWFKLTRDIDLNIKDWTPIGFDNKSEFNGHFDGSGHTILNLKIKDSVKNAGLFGYIARGGVTDLKLRGVDIQGNSSGGLAGNIVDGAEISRCSVEGTVMGYGGQYDATGGFVGTMRGSAIEYCEFIGSVWAIRDAGGLVGNGQAATINYSTTSADVYGGRKVGGFIGEGYGGKFLGCESVGTVVGEVYSDVFDPAAGGFAGEFGEGVLEKCVSKSDVRVVWRGGMTAVGGLVGQIPGYSSGDTVIKECSAFGSVTAKDADRVGGFIGDARFFDTISGCVASGDVIGHDAVGGFIGYAGLCDEISDNRASGNVTGEKDVSAMIGRMDQYVDKYITNCVGTGKVTVLE